MEILICGGAGEKMRLDDHQDRDSAQSVDADEMWGHTVSSGDRECARRE
jgi:hypothetical protein